MSIRKERLLLYPRRGFLSGQNDRYSSTFYAMLLVDASQTWWKEEFCVLVDDLRVATVKV